MGPRLETQIRLINAFPRGPGGVLRSHWLVIQREVRNRAPQRPSPATFNLCKCITELGEHEVHMSEDVFACVLLLCVCVCVSVVVFLWVCVWGLECWWGSVYLRMCVCVCLYLCLCVSVCVWCESVCGPQGTCGSLGVYFRGHLRCLVRNWQVWAG